MTQETGNTTKSEWTDEQERYVQEIVEQFVNSGYVKPSNRQNYYERYKKELINQNQRGKKAEQ